MGDAIRAGPPCPVGGSEKGHMDAVPGGSGHELQQLQPSIRVPVVVPSPPGPERSRRGSACRSRDPVLGTAVWEQGHSLGIT